MELYDVTVARYLQIMEAMIAFMEKSRNHFDSGGIEPDSVVMARIHPYMHPFGFQVISTVMHSVFAIKALETGEFAPQVQWYSAYQDFIDMLRRSCEELRGFDRDLVNGLDLDGDMRTERGEAISKRDYLLVRAIPNFYFHATTAYDILRMLDAPIGKVDFLGMTDWSPP
jgi:hypothetical protein